MSTVPTDGDSDAGGARLIQPWAPGAKCYVCDRLVAEVSAWQDDDGGQWNAHWDCHQRAKLKERARQTGSDESLRRMRGRLGAYTRWANADAQERFAAGYRMRQGLQAKFEREVDPEGKLSPQERAKRAEYARTAHMQRMALKSVKARRRGKA
jgi:hypothetical protein